MQLYITNFCYLYNIFFDIVSCFWYALNHNIVKSKTLFYSFTGYYIQKKKVNRSDKYFIKLQYMHKLCFRRDL